MLKKILFLLVLAAAVLAGFFLFRSFYGSSAPAPYTKMLPKLSEASVAKVPVLFPKQFILGVDPEVVEANVIDDSKTSTIILLRFKDEQNSPQALLDEYLDYAPRAYWTVEESEKSAQLATLKLSRGIQRVFITIRPASSGGLTSDIEYRVVVQP